MLLDVLLGHDVSSAASELWSGQLCGLRALCMTDCEIGRRQLL